MATAETKAVSEKTLGKTEATYLADVAETIRDDALHRARSGLGALVKQLDLKDLFKRRDFIERFKYGLAKGVAMSIAANDRRVAAVYLFETEGYPDIEDRGDVDLDGTVHLLAVVSSSSAALESFIESLDRSLIESFAKLPAEAYQQRDWCLDVKLITHQDIADNRGYASLLNSIHTPALRIWKRET